jgi:hypothetical protein
MKNEQGSRQTLFALFENRRLSPIAPEGVHIPSRCILTPSTNGVSGRSVSTQNACSMQGSQGTTCRSEHRIGESRQVGPSIIFQTLPALKTVVHRTIQAKDRRAFIRPVSHGSSAPASRGKTIGAINRVLYSPGVEAILTLPCHNPTRRNKTLGPLSFSL